MAGYGFTGHVGFGQETTWGTAVAATDYVEAMSESVAATLDRFDTKNIVGRYSEPDDEAGMLRVAGDISFAAHPESIAHMIYAAFGVGSGALVGGTLIKHRFTPLTSDFTAATNALPPYTFEIFRDVTSSQQYDGCQVSQLQLSVAPNQDVRAAVSIIGKGTQNFTKSTASFPSSSQAPFTFDTASISLGGNASSIVEAFTFTFDNQLEGVPTLNASTEVAKIRRTGPQTARLEGQLGFEDITEYNNFINQTEFAFAANFTKADSFSMLMLAPRVVYTAWPLGMGDRGRQVVGFSATCRYQATSLQAVEIQVSNTTSAYTL